MKKALFNLTVILLLTGLFTPLAVEASTITVDGNFLDWNGITALGTDPSGDASGGIVDYDNLWATAQNNTLYVSYQTASNIDFANNAWRYSVYIDADNNPSTGFKGTAGNYLIGAEYLIEGGTLHQYTGSGTDWGWNATAVLTYSYATNRLEMAVPETSLGLGTNYTVKIMLLGNNPTTIDYAKDDKSGFAYSSEGGSTAPINSSTKYLWYFGNWNAPGDAHKIEEAKNFRFVLVHPTNSDITPQNIAEVKKGKDGILGTNDDVFFIGYISVGEDIRTDQDHNILPATGDGTGPVYYNSETKQLVYENKGYASYYLDELINTEYNKTGHDGLPDRNWQYRGCYCNPGNAEYQNVLKTGVKAQDGFAGVDEIFNVYGCEGIMLDTIDVVNPVAWGFPFYFEWTAPGLYDFIKNIRQWYPDKMILLNRGLVYYDPNQKQQDGDRYLKEWNLGPYIDMILFEGYYWPGDEVRNRYYWAPRVNAEADRPDGFKIIGLDYVGDASITVDGQFDDWTIWGLNKEGVEKLDNALIWSKGVCTPDELADDVSIAGIDMVDVWAANEAANENLYLKVKFKGTVDFTNYDYHIFLDTDKDKDTGYWRACGSATGADYMIFDGDNQYLHLYKYTGTDHVSWSWQWLGFVPFSIGNDGAVSNSIEISVPKNLIGESNNFDEALRLTFLAEKKDGTYIDDFAPNDTAVDYYEYLFRTKGLAVSETIKEQGWLEYVIPLSSDNGEIDYTAYNYNPPADSQPPVWDSTAATPGPKTPAPPVQRIGIQEAEPGDHSVTVRWDVARDQTRPVRYNIYYSSTSPINFSTATKLAHVDNSAAGKNYYSGSGVRKDFPGSESSHGFYSERIGEGVYPYEYTVTGLTNGQTYYFAVRAEDSFATPHEDTNTVELAAVPFAPRVCSINIDGNFNDWQGARQLDYSPCEIENEAGFPPELDILDIWATNSTCALYLKIKCKSTMDIANSNYDVFIDVDGDTSTGYTGPYMPSWPWASWAIGADYLVQDGALFEYAGGGWNWTFIWNGRSCIGNDDGINNAIEMYIPRLPISYPGSPFFGKLPSNDYKILVRSDRLVSSEQHICDYAPNDPFSHAYTYDITGLVIDGHFEDWAPWMMDGDYSGDVSPGDIVDWKRFAASRQEGSLYLYYQTVSDIDFTSNAWRYAIYLDTDNNPATGYTGEEVVNGKPVANWHLDENTGATAHDSTENNNDGAITGAVWTTGISNSALSFDGIDDIVTVADSSSLDITGNLTLSGWANFTQLTSQKLSSQYIAKKDSAFKLGAEYQSFPNDEFPQTRAGQSSTPCIDATTAKYGSNSSKFIRTSKGNSSLIGRYIDLTGVTSITLHGYNKAQNVVKGTNSWEMLGFFGRWYDANKTQLAGCPDLGCWQGTFDWTLREGTLSVPAGAKYYRILCLGLEQCTGTGWWDDVRITDQNGNTLFYASFEHNEVWFKAYNPNTGWVGIPTTQTTGQFTHYAGKYDGGFISIYQDGIEKAKLKYSAGLNASTANMLMGSGLAGSIDEVKLYNRACNGRDGSYLIGAEYLIEGSALHQYTGNGTSWSWNVVSSVDYAYTGNTMEMAIPDSDLGLNEESAITALFVGNNPTTVDYARDDKSGACLWAPWMYDSRPHYFF